MILDPRTPIIVGVGQSVERIDEAGYRGLSPADLAALAAQRAIADAGDSVAILPLIGIAAAVRTFEDSKAMKVPFGRPDKFPLAVTRRLGITPPRAILDKLGGQSPLAMIMEIGERIMAGEAEGGIAFGAEAISTVRHLMTSGESRDWAETLEGAIDDRGLGGAGLLSPLSASHGIVTPPIAYAIMENARRGRLGLSRAAYAAEMGRLFAPFSAVAAANPHSATVAPAMSAEEIATVSERNRLVVDPFPLKVIARDQVNQGAAVLVLSVAAAERARVPRDKWIFVHGAALAQEREILERPDVGAYPAANAAIASALETAGQTADAMAAFEFYSCFPIPVFNAAIDGLGLSPEDPRGLTTTGGLPYFGGPGNNYSMHGIAAMVERLRDVGGHGLIGVNGGFQSKYGAAVLSAEPRAWPGFDTRDTQARLDAAAKAEVADRAEGPGRISGYTVVWAKGAPIKGIALGELADGRRFIANPADDATLARMVETDPAGAAVILRPGEPILFTFP